MIGQDFKQFPIQATMVLLGALAQDFMHRLRNTSNTQGCHGHCRCNHNASILPLPDQSPGGRSLLARRYPRSLSSRAAIFKRCFSKPVFSA